MHILDTILYCMQYFDTKLIVRYNTLGNINHKKTITSSSSAQCVLVRKCVVHKWFLKAPYKSPLPPLSAQTGLHVYSGQ